MKREDYENRLNETAREEVWIDVKGWEYKWRDEKISEGMRTEEPRRDEKEEGNLDISFLK